MSDELEFLESILKEYDVPTVLAKLVDTNSRGSSQNEITATELNSKFQSGASNYSLGNLDYPLVLSEGDQIRKINYEILHSGWYSLNL